MYATARPLGISPLGERPQHGSRYAPTVEPELGKYVVASPMLDETIGNAQPDYANIAHTRIC